MQGSSHLFVSPPNEALESKHSLIRRPLRLCPLFQVTSQTHSFFKCPWKLFRFPGGQDVQVVQKTWKGLCLSVTSKLVCSVDVVSTKGFRKDWRRSASVSKLAFISRISRRMSKAYLNLISDSCLKHESCSFDGRRFHKRTEKPVWGPLNYLTEQSEVFMGMTFSFIHALIDLKIHLTLESFFIFL